MGYKYPSEFHAKEAQRANQKSKDIRNKEYVVRAKSKPCTDCGIQYNHWIMQFDHREPLEKMFSLSELKHSYSLKKLQVEIDKCDVVCANCHSDRTYRYKHWLIRRKIELKAKAESPQGDLFQGMIPTPKPAKTKRNL